MRMVGTQVGIACLRPEHEHNRTRHSSSAGCAIDLDPEAEAQGIDTMFEFAIIPLEPFSPGVNPTKVIGDRARRDYAM